MNKLIDKLKHHVTGAIERGEAEPIIADTTYNGWTNWDTWAANRWLTNDGWLYTTARLWIRQGRPADKMHIFIDEIKNPDQIDYAKVNWEEVKESLL
jgi:hypothetical protein